MGMTVNRFEVLGHVGNDPEVRYTHQGATVCTLSVATNEKWTDKVTGEQKERTEWHRLVAFGFIADICKDYIKKGTRIYGTAKSSTRKWEDQQGTARYTQEFVLNEIIALDGRSFAEHNDFAGEQQQRAQGNEPPIHTEDQIPFEGE